MYDYDVLVLSGDKPCTEPRATPGLAAVQVGPEGSTRPHRAASATQECGFIQKWVSGVRDWTDDSDAKA
ncbi:hypothetical protein NM688_g2040 [Phlebia brevispora]|uniref:Uncharacterized protein n=1 Tax=Phlebia brevispora TaxID=194682 RepID=A0ACC1TAE0_9APHY|nr:hypothetical protein NM688_g2040 [Phlebia brevispora]